MFRRKFLQRMAAGLTALGTVEGGQVKSVTWRIQGFTCPTCAVGLEVMLREQAGVKRATASYEKAMATIEFDPGVVTEKALKGFIAELGFRVEEGRS